MRIAFASCNLDIALFKLLLFNIPERNLISVSGPVALW